MKPFLVTMWALLVVGGFTALLNYQARPGAKETAPARWQLHTNFSLDQKKFNLIVSLHPQCPCSAATVEELNAILAQTASLMHVQILLFVPAGANPDWARTSLAAGAARLPNTTVTPDVDGVYAAAIGARTSGDSQLFDPDGRLIFHGGITALRGHAGDNAGADAIIARVVKGEASLAETPVFGCAIHTRAGTETAP